MDLHCRPDAADRLADGPCPQALQRHPSAFGAEDEITQGAQTALRCPAASRSVRTDVTSRVDRVLKYGSKIHRLQPWPPSAWTGVPAAVERVKTRLDGDRLHGRETSLMHKLVVELEWQPCDRRRTFLAQHGRPRPALWTLRCDVAAASDWSPLIRPSQFRWTS